MAHVAEVVGQAQSAGLEMGRVVISGTPGFLEELRELTQHHRLDAEVQVSPGTWVYWDTGYDRIVPGLFEFAALLLCHVIDRPGPGLLTLDIGSKRWSVDQGPLTLFSARGLEVVQTNEEHTVLRHRDDVSLRVGDAVLAAPQHVCPTVNLWETFAVVGEHGRVERTAEPVTARNR
jgi:D-serine deaminase-like pyridoxal phosphate-dependent protein